MANKVASTSILKINSGKADDLPNAVLARRGIVIVQSLCDPCQFRSPSLVVGKMLTLELDCVNGILASDGRRKKCQVKLEVLVSS